MLDPAVLDARARTVLELVSKGTGVLEADEAFDIEAHHALARAAAAESVVLLANEGQLLPIRPDAKVALIGEFARTPRFQGAGSSYVNPTRVDSPLEELRAVFGDLSFAPGYPLTGGPPADGTDLVQEAIATAASAEVVIVFIGLPSSDESEGFDRTHLDLPADQLDLLAAVARQNPRVVTVLVNGGPVDLRRVIPHSPALLEAWLGGQAAGGAIADVLSGAVNPSGRLAETLPLRVEDNPSYLNFPGDEHVVSYGEGIYIGYRAYDKANQQVAFPFGFGLSYTSFEFSELTVEVSGSAADETLSARVGVTVTNTGARDGAEVVQVYVRDPTSTVHRPVRELKGFAKVAVPAGESSRVSVELDARAFAYWSERFHRWIIEAGEFVIEVGQHSRRIVLSRSIEVYSPPVRAPLTRLSTLFEWHADPVGLELLREASLATGAPLTDPEFLKVMGTMPMSSLATFPGWGADVSVVDRAVQEWQRRTGG